MIGSYMTDTISIITVSYDINGVRTETTTTARARVEDYNGIVNNEQGNEVVGNMKIAMKNSETLTYNDYIKVLTKGGVAYQQPSKEWQIKKISVASLFGGKGYIEVVI